MKENPKVTQDDSEIDAEAIAAAADETPTGVTPPEVDARTEQLTEWDDVPAAHGTAAPKVASEDDGNDEDTISAKLVDEGTDEADREQRLAAADPDFEP